MKVKNSTVKWWDFDPRFYQALKIIGAVFSYETYRSGSEVESVMTSGRDGKHMEDSLHYAGRAADFRLPGRSIFKRKKTLAVAKLIVNELSQQLGEDFDVVLEIHRNFFKNHIHIELDPKS